MKRFGSPIAVVLVLCFSLISVQPAGAAIVPSKTAADQTLDMRQADLESIRDFVARDEVATLLADHGFTPQEVDQRLNRLSNEDMHALAQNLNQIQAAGISTEQWMWILIGAVAVLVLVIVAD